MHVTPAIHCSSTKFLLNIQPYGIQTLNHKFHLPYGMQSIQSQFYQIAQLALQDHSQIFTIFNEVFS